MKGEDGELRRLCLGKMVLGVPGKLNYSLFADRLTSATELCARLQPQGEEVQNRKSLAGRKIKNSKWSYQGPNEVKTGHGGICPYHPALWR